MPFLIQYTEDSTPTVLVLSPGPTEVDYPDYENLTTKQTQDHAVVIQRPIHDSRERKWIWKRYRPAAGNYETQWVTLLSLQARRRHQNAEDPVVEIWEDETVGENGFDLTDDGEPPDLVTYTNIVWTQVKFIRVYRKSQKGGGPIIYDDSIMEFIVVDPAWENF